MNPFEIRPSVFFDRTDSSIYSFGEQRPSQVARASEARIEQHTKIFASMCPDEILDYCDDYSTRVYHTTLMLGDVSGFTDLAEKYTKFGKGGPSKLTETLNSYIGAMVQEILSHNGDVLKFSGDAFIVMWKLGEGMTMRDLAVEAIQTACIIQKHFGIYETEIDVTLRVKLAIASGKTYFTTIGDPNAMSYYIITGKPVWDVKNAEGLCRGGDILVAPSSWQWANPNEYVFETLPDGVHTLIIGSSTAWYHSRGSEIGSIHSDDYNESCNVESRKSKASIMSKMYPDNGPIANEDDQDFEDDHFSQVDYSLRPKVIRIAKAHMKDALRSYMLRPVVRSVEMDEPLEYLTEMRQVVILFVNVITSNVGKKSLIALVNSTYKTVCRLIGDVQGCVNKTSLFDKDLMFLCIFGLRGDKHELESQIGLRCAYKIRAELIAMKNVKSVTIGVTTGVTYCGVVGHILRREYTVIGMSVNKAARLMCAYRDKVVCDRESFLHSHLEARHFILQEPKNLKGITNAGPVYEFQDIQELKDSDLVWSKYPLLGRDFEIKVFRQMLAALIEYNNTGRSKPERKPKHNTLIIKGESRIGKTRLLDEITQNIPPGVACHYLALAVSDSKIPYGVLHLLFSIPMGFVTTTTRREREEKILQCLGPFRNPHYLAVLNEIFHVRFTLTSSLKILDAKERASILRKFLQILMYICFNGISIIIIDDAEYSDEESMILLDSITKSDTALFILSFGRKLVEFKNYPRFHGKAMVLEIGGIDKLYHAGLACQILNVSGIPAELEKAIQEKSLGNPGWIESYLVSLVQAGGLVMLNINKKEADTEGYVLPPISMLGRLVNAVSKSTGRIEERTDKWQMYRTSVKDSILSLIENSGVERSNVSLDAGDTTIAVCKITENYNLDEIGGEITIDVMILKLFDSLTPLDQLLLKCASVLGESLNRKLLESLMEDVSSRDIAVCKVQPSPISFEVCPTIGTILQYSFSAVTKLFRIGVFSCGAGDFSRSSNPLVYLRNLKPDRHLELEIRCDCIGIEIPEEMEDLPKYAFCGLMRFKMTMFRETTYRNFYQILSIGLSTRQGDLFAMLSSVCCRLNGAQIAQGFFPKKLKQWIQAGLSSATINVKKIGALAKLLTENQKMELHSKALKYIQQHTKRCIACGEGQFTRLLGKTSTKTRPSRRLTVTDIDQILDNLAEDVSEEEHDQKKDYDGVMACCVNLCRRVERKTTNTFANIDFINCQCHLILMSVYTQILDHCHGIGKNNLTLTAILETIEICLLIHNIPQARKLVEDAEHILHQMSESYEDEPITLTYLTGKIQILQGRCFLGSGLLSEAEKSLMSAMSNLTFKFPKTRMAIETKTLFQLEELRFRLAFHTAEARCSSEDDAVDYSELLANCLAHMFDVFRVRVSKKKARLAAVWGLNAVLSSTKDFSLVCACLANMLITAHIYKHWSILPQLEQFGIELCANKKSNPDLTEVKVIAELYTAIFFSRWVRGLILRAIKIGFTCLRMTEMMNCASLKLIMLPRLIHLLMISCQHSQAVAQLRELEFLSNNVVEKSARTWYYALCADILLDTGLAVVPFDHCEQYYFREGEAMFSIRDPEAQKRYFVSMWLWCVRTEQWEAAELWYESSAILSDIMMDEHIVAAAITALKYLEGLLILYVHKVNSRSISAHVTMAEIKGLFKKTTHMIKIVKIALPRYWLLKAYYNMIKFRKDKALKILRKAKKIALEMDHIMMYNWIEHCQKSWTESLSNVQRDLWREAHNSSLSLNWTEVNANDARMLPYTCPLPQYTY